MQAAQSIFKLSDAVQTKNPETDDIGEPRETHPDNDSATPFELVSKNLRAIGLLSIDDFLRLSPNDDKINYEPELDLDTPPRRTSTHTPEPSPAVESTGALTTEMVIPTMRMQTVARLHQACQRVFGSTDPLDFEFIEENGPDSAC